MCHGSGPRKGKKDQKKKKVFFFQIQENQKVMLFFFFCLFAFSRATPEAYGGSQASGRIGAVAASLRQSHSNVGSEPRPRPTPRLTLHRVLNPLSKAKDGTRSLMILSRIH